MSLNGFRKAMRPYTPPFVEQGDGITPALGDDVRVCPFLPVKRMANDHQSAYGQMDWPIVIEAGEPIAIVEIAGVAGKWIVPASPVAYSLTYSAMDIGVTEDIDNEGSAVAAAGVSTAKIPAALPIGLAHQPIRANPSLVDGTEKYDNFNPTLKEVVVRRRHFMVPYIRKGSTAMGTLKEGDLVAVTAPAGNTLSSTARPVLKAANIAQANIHATPTVDANNLGTVIGRVLRVWDGLPGTYDMSFVVTPRGSGLSGTDTGGVPQELYHAGNVPSNSTNNLPADISEAGAVLMVLEW